MIQKSLESISLEDIQMLIENKVAESKTIEYKAEININSDGDKKEFLYDVSSFANASGGDILFGVTEGKEKGIPETLEGIEGNMDELKRRIESMLLTSVDPRIINLKIKDIPLENGKSILIIRVPKSFSAPHQITFKDASKFYSRTNSGKYILDVRELRNAFLLSETLIERMKTFVTDRIAKIVANESFIAMPEGAKIILHFLPVSAFDNEQRHLSLESIKNSAPTPLGSGGYEQRVNLEGILSYSRLHSITVSDAYIQVYRTGILETVNSALIEPTFGKKQIFMDGEHSLEFQLLKSIASCLRFLKQSNVPAPVYVCLNILGVKDYTINSSHLTPVGRDSHKMDREHLSLPEVVIMNYDNDFVPQIREWFNMIWNACGYDTSFVFTRNQNLVVLVEKISKGLSF